MTQQPPMTKRSLDCPNRSSQMAIAYRGLEARENRLRAIFDDAPCAIVYMARDGRILESNTTAAKFCGHTRIGLLGRSFYEICLGQNPPLGPDIEKTVADQGHPSIISTFATVDGVSRTLEWHIEPFSDDDICGGSGWVAAGVDISRHHETLYTSKSLERIDMAAYIKQLANAIFASHMTDHGHIDLFIDVDNTRLNIDQALPCGLIVSELVTNAMKYAFPDRRDGVIIVSLSSDAHGHCSLTVEDEGVGMPCDVYAGDEKSLGMDLVHGLAINQLGGTMTVKNLKKGAGFCVRFEPWSEAASP